jgi:hypothetical protein
VAKGKILFYDIETSPLKAWIWGCGEQYIRHQQLDKDYNMWGIICVTYCWNDGKPAKVIDWGYEEQDTKRVVQEFDEIIKSADHIIGKNNKRFDDKMITTLRMLTSLEGMPRWAVGNDDLERQMRKHFRLPSQSLDYISSQLGYGGKIKMEMQDWIDVVEKNDNGKKSFDKMIKYGKKDVVDTRALWNRLSEHFDPVFNFNTFNDTPKGDLLCKRCGSCDLRKNGTRASGGVKYQEYICNKCLRYAGRHPVNTKKPILK